MIPISTIFQAETTALESQITALQSQLAATQQRIALLNEAETVADGAIAALQGAVEKVTALAPDAIANLKSAVLNLFQGGDNPNDGSGNQQKPAPQPPAPQPEALTGQSTEWASPLACTIEVAAPPATLDYACPVPDVPEQKPYVELVPVSHSVAYQRRTVNGEIICAYLGGNNKSRLKDWGSWLCNQHTVGTGFELREAKRLDAFKYEIKIWGMSLDAVERLAEANTQKSPPSNYANAPKRKIEAVAPAPKPLQIEEIGVGDIVRSVTVKHWEYRVLGITADKFIDCERIGVTPAIRAGLHPASVELVSKAIKVEPTEEEIAIANESIQPEAPTLTRTTYNPYPIGRKGAAANWKAYQERKLIEAEQKLSTQATTLEQEIAAGDWIELLVNGDCYQVGEVDNSGIHLVTGDGNITVQPDEVKLLLHVPADWKPF